MTSRHLKLALVLTVVLAFALSAHHVRRWVPESHQQIPSSIAPLQVEGRWKSVRASLGLPSLPDRVLPSAFVPARTSYLSNHQIAFSRLSIPSRFDLKRKRSLEDLSTSSHAVAKLFFAPDAAEQRRISLEEFLGASRASTGDKQPIANLKETNSWRSRAARLLDIGRDRRHS